MNVTRFLTAAAVAALFAGPVAAQTEPSTTTDTTTATQTTTTTQSSPSSSEMGKPVGMTSIGRMGDSGASTSTTTTTTNMGASMSGNVEIVANAPIPDSPENRALYGQPESNGGKRTPAREGPVGR